MATAQSSDALDPSLVAGGSDSSPVDGSSDLDPSLVTTTQSATLGEKAGAVGEGVAGGALRTVGVVPGAIGGAALGTAVAPFLGPAAPAGPFIGGLAGAAYGMWAGDTAAEGLGLRPPEQMREEVRKYGVLGESFGGSMGALGFPYGAVATGFRLGESVAGKLLNKIIDSAKSSPWKFLATEASMASSAAGAAMSAESLFPGNVGARMSAEMVGGLINPSTYVRAGAERAAGFVRTTIQNFSPSGRETAAAKMLAEVYAKTGEDPDAVYQAYKALGVPGLENLTPAQKTGSMALGAMEDFLADFSGKFSHESAEKARQGLDVLRGHINLLTRTGDPEALKAAAQARDIYYRTLLQGRVDGALAQAEQAVGKVTKDTPETRAVLSKTVRDILDTAIVDARKAESELWQKWTKVEGDKPAQFDNLLRQFAEEYDGVLPEYRPKRVPLEVEKFLKRVNKPGEAGFEYDPATLSFKDVPGKDPGTTVDEMYKLRSELLNEARQLTINGDHSGARAMSNLAEAIIDDLDASVSPAGKKLYDDARGFTREFHDAFTRSFVGKSSAAGKYGDRMAPELTLKRALASGDELGALQLGEIEHATRFLNTRGLQDEGAINIVMDAQERFLRLAAARSIDSETGKLNPKRLSDFMHNNQELMNRFPGTKQDLSNAIKTTRGAQDMEAMAKKQNRLMDDLKVFSKIAKGDGIQQAQAALLSDNMETELGKLITMVKRGTVGKDGKPIIDSGSAVAGLRSAVYTAAINASTGRNRGELNLNQVQSLLFNPPPGQKSAIQVLQEADIISPREIGKIKQLFGALESIQRSQRVGTAVEVKQDVTDAALTLFSRMLGSNVASTASKAAGSNTPSLIAAGAGARFAEYLFAKMGATTAKQMFVDAISNPQSGKLDLILQQASRMTPKQQIEQAMQMNAWMVSLGALNAPEKSQQVMEPWTTPRREQIK